MSCLLQQTRTIPDPSPLSGAPREELPPRRTAVAALSDCTPSARQTARQRERYRGKKSGYRWICWCSLGACYSSRRVGIRYCSTKTGAALHGVQLLRETNSRLVPLHDQHRRHLLHLVFVANVSVARAVHLFLTPVAHFHCQETRLDGKVHLACHLLEALHFLRTRRALLGVTDPILRERRCKQTAPLRESPETTFSGRHSSDQKQPLHATSDAVSPRPRIQQVIRNNREVASFSARV